MTFAKSRYKLKSLLVLLSSLSIYACSDMTGSTKEAEQVEGTAILNAGDTRSLSSKAPLTAESERYALAINGKAIPLGEIDKRIELKLFDLEWAAYELRKAALSDYLEEQAKQQKIQSVKVLIEPPQPPRIHLSTEQQSLAMRFRDENKAAPVRLSVFCNYQSSHCARMQGVYQQIQQEYGALVNYEFFDFPLPFHPFSKSASQAVRCAHSMGEFESFHKALWLNQHALNEGTYLNLSKQLKLDEKQFRTCLNSQTETLVIEGNQDLAENLGFSQVPVTLINGLYVSGPKPFEVFQFYIDQELRRLGFKTDAVVTHQAKISAINDQERTMPESDRPDTLPEATGSAGADEMSELPADMPDPETLEYKARPVVQAVGEIPLSRDWLEDQLLQQSELEAHFQPAEHEVEGVRLAKLSGVSQSEFYQTLGLQEGDVVMRVNEQWVHESQNDLFTALENGEQVSVVLVRKGLPVHLVYRIRD